MNSGVKTKSPFTITWAVFDFAGQPLIDVERVKE
jgi:hypothetical protein